MFLCTVVTNNHCCLLNDFSSTILFSLYYWVITWPEKIIYRLSLSLHKVFIFCLCVTYSVIGFQGEREREREREMRESECILVWNEYIWGCCSDLGCVFSCVDFCLVYIIWGHVKSQLSDQHKRSSLPCTMNSCIHLSKHGWGVAFAFPETTAHCLNLLSLPTGEGFREEEYEGRDTWGGRFT